jgi:hypothetical protein
VVEQPREGLAVASLCDRAQIRVEIGAALRVLDRHGGE